MNDLDRVFAALADSTRRDILARVSESEMSIGEIANYYDLKFGSISKHIKVLETARLVTKHRRGKEQIVSIVPATLGVARKHIERYAAIWADRFDQLDEIFREEE